MDEEKLNALAREVAYLSGEVKRLSSDIARLEARQQTISELLEERHQHRT